MNKEPAILSILEWWYYYSSGIVKVVEGIAILVTFGLVKFFWVYTYACYRARHISEARIKHIAKWVDANPNKLISIDPDNIDMQKILNKNIFTKS
jgi:hypothetical protein